MDGDPETVDLVREPCGDSAKPLVGVRMINSFPFDVQISSGEIGGPSAGLMWALGLYDLLTPGDLTGGRTIAGTGQIALDGTVIPIGGIEEKLTAAADAGATVFLVPAGQHGGGQGLGRPRPRARSGRHLRRRARVPRRSLARSVLREDR